MSARKRNRLPKPVEAIYEAARQLEDLYPGRRFTPDGHMVGAKLYPASYPCHDAYDENGNVQIKLTAGRSISLYSECERLVVLRIISPNEAEIVFDGSGKVARDKAGKLQVRPALNERGRTTRVESYRLVGEGRT